MQARNTGDATARIRLNIGLTAHRDVIDSEVPRLRREVRSFFQRLQAEFPDLPLRLISALAEGGDQLVAEEALALGIELMVPLPMPKRLPPWVMSKFGASKAVNWTTDDGQKY